MKYLSPVLMLVLAGCASSQAPSSNDSMEWQQYGIQRAEAGYTKLAEHEFHKDDELYAAYSKGYEAGRKNYCAQDAFSLGESTRYYRGICDDVDDRFHREYELGKTLRGSKRY
ncbi:DUF2799 domain-containing protein [Vibrio sp. CAU 1672]|uniref:DUF2799 domain-containing protein n=1 Tax=Vibrio sp. CAU 1672 TaxID=3032594 RepID=UPI0023DA5017|nr:DUF2799 domain-containing protein [Vibrio sp. CAU 1672]MDF2153207.1 DUF2799 domain-containing protein [Vibrio sp. CAU 1672]